MNQLTPHAWEHITLLLGEILDRPDREGEILARESPEIRGHLQKLLAAHRSAGPADSPRRTIASRYELLRLLGSGGNGEAWLAVDAHSGAQVVLKMPLHWEWYREDLTRRFLAEAETLRRLEHPGIVALLDSGTIHDGAPFFVMPYVEGVTLRERLRRGPIESEEAAAIVEQLGAALSAAHREEIIHRDLKPENVMLRDIGDSPRAILIDFGIAIPADRGSAAGATTSFFGTTRYMAPEQLLGKPSPASDVYALALLAYEMLAGRPLFVSENPVGLFQEQRTFRESALSSLPYSVRHTLMEGLRWRPEKRPPAAEFAASLASAIRRWGGYWMPSRRFVLASLAAATPVAAWIAYQMRPLSAEERTIVYKAGQTFTEHGWSKIGTVDIDVTILDPNNQRILGNRLSSSEQGSYHTNLPERVRRAGLKNPWRLTGYVIPVHGGCNFAVGFKEVGVGFLMAACVPDSGRSTVAAPLTYIPKLSDVSAPATFSSDRMTEMRMTFDPKTQTASIAIDGRTLITGYRGRREYVGQGVGLGFSVEHSKVGEGIFGDLRFEMF